MDQHEFVAKCYEKYAELGLEPGNPDDGVWQNAHYPAPDPEGDSTIPMLFDDHQQQGLYQSEEYGRQCFWGGDVKKFLTNGPFVEGWFELWDLYDKWMEKRVNTANKKIHGKKNEEGKSVHAVKLGKKLHEVKNEEGKSVHAVKLGKKLHEEKDDLGRSVLAMKAITAVHEEKDEFGRSVQGVKNAERLHREKDEFGRSISGVKNAEKMNSQVWESTKDGFKSSAAGVVSHNKANGWDPSARVRIFTTNEKMA